MLYTVYSCNLQKKADILLRFSVLARDIHMFVSSLPLYHRVFLAAVCKTTLSPTSREAKELGQCLKETHCAAEVFPKKISILQGSPGTSWIHLLSLFSVTKLCVFKVFYSGECMAKMNDTFFFLFFKDGKHAWHSLHTDGRWKIFPKLCFFLLFFSPEAAQKLKSLR